MKSTSSPLSAGSSSPSALLAVAPLLGAEEPKKPDALPTPAPAPAGSGAAALEKLKALAGDWVEVEPKMGPAGASSRATG